MTPAEEGRVKEKSVRMESGRLASPLAVVRWFEDAGNAERAIEALERAGYPENTLSLREFDQPEHERDVSPDESSGRTMVAVQAKGEKAAKAWRILCNDSFHSSAQKDRKASTSTDHETEMGSEPLIGVFGSVETADRAIRGLISLGVPAGQIELLDQKSLLVEHGPDFAADLATVKSAEDLTTLDDKLIEALQAKMVEIINLPLYLTDRGVPKDAAEYHAQRLREGFALLLVEPDERQIVDAHALLERLGLRPPDLVQPHHLANL